MQALNRFIYIIFGILICFSCKKDITNKQVIDNVTYGLDTSILYQSSAQKVKQKTTTQYVSILYSDLFSRSISSKELSELSELSLGIGDKTMGNELTLSHYLKATDLSKPSDGEMRLDVEKFVVDTYRKFFQRFPTPYEKIFLTDLINKDPSIIVVDVYTSFVLSNEYYYY